MATRAASAGRCCFSRRFGASLSAAAAASPLGGEGLELEESLEQFPPVRHAFAYGSGVFQQPGLYRPDGSGGAPMIDFVLVVDDPARWHSENLRLNRSHYSFLGALGADAVTACAEHIGAGVHFNTLVPWRQQVMKYGVVSGARLAGDLTAWDALYIGGRMHKPVRTLVEDGAIAAANAANLAAALRAALLLLPPAFSTEMLLHTICGLSYGGDVRMGVAEDGGKVAKIAAGSREGLLALYAGALQAAQGAGHLHAAPSGWAQPADNASRADLFARLPQGVLAEAAALTGAPWGGGPAGEGRPGGAAAVAEAAVASGRHGALLAAALAAIVRRSSARQAAAGLLAAGPTRAAAYVAAKLRKAWRQRS
eukprot:jgi/Tetstr1/422867/TSEL_013658.t1